MDKPSLKIGLTGGIASGKTTVSNLFAQLGVPIIDADVISRSLTEPETTAFKLIVQTFGVKILQADGRLNRAKLAKIIFSDTEQRHRLEKILHPSIQQLMLAKAAKIKTAYCILSIPLLIETNQIKLVDHILVIDCPIDLQRQRIIDRNGISSNQIEQILMSQTTREARLAIADDVILNDISLEQLKSKVLALHKDYSKT
ncbi:dephospho-CoA kinase [Candidatus Marithrix sp. Canyon 246]|uniref:dephospho-CoA kinase n=1 Tax=Candidatus Marithrix sp. Canyon 246 TaxID=1827136 RepID=UPI00084A0C34|nr:dephospho-CoA kinase [Candidatus Marithrix sp. Canyon 246]